MRVKDVMSESPQCCTPDATLRDAAHMMDECDCGAIPVVDKDKRRIPIGVITDRDIACRAVAHGKNPTSTKVAECMSRPLATIDRESSVEECCESMERLKVRRMLVVDDRGELCGIVSQADIALRADDERQAGEFVREVSEPIHEASLVC